MRKGVTRTNAGMDSALLAAIRVARGKPRPGAPLREEVAVRSQAVICGDVSMDAGRQPATSLDAG